MFSYPFSKSFRLLKSRDFRLCLKYGKSCSSRFLRVHMRKISLPQMKLGLTVSKRYGKAVERNCFKRKVREAFRLSQYELPKYVQISVYPLQAARSASFHEIQADLKIIMKTFNESDHEYRSENSQSAHVRF